MTTRIASPSDRFIGYSTRPADQLHFQLQPQHQYQYQHHHLGGGGGGVFLREGPHSGFLPAPTVQSTALPPNVDTQTASHQRQASTTMASGSSPPYMPTTAPHPRRTSRTGTGTGTGTGRGGRGTAWQPQRLNSNANSTASNYAYWGNNHEALIAQQLSQAPAANDVNETNETNETYLSALADNDFSSPSSYPSFTNPLPAPRPSTVQHQRRAQVQASAPGPDSAPYSRSTAPHNNNNDAAVAFTGACNLTRNFSAPERSETQLTTDTNTTTTTALESQNTLFTNDTQEWAELFDTPISSFDENMPVTRSSRRLEVATPPLDSVHPSKRRRTSTNARTPTLRKSASSRNRPTEIKDFDDDDLFVDTKNTRTAPGQEPDAEDLTTIDLTETNEVPEELSKPEKDNRTKIAAFQCVICMDDAAGLTVTHCGKFLMEFTLHLCSFLNLDLPIVRTYVLCPMSAFIVARRNYQGKMPHVPPEAGYETSQSLQHQDQRILASRIEADDCNKEGQKKGELNIVERWSTS